MAAIWKGSVTFGLVNVPVRVHSATTDHDVDLHQVHLADGGRIRYRRTCEACGQVIAYEDIGRAAEAGDQLVILTDEDLAALPVSRTREIEVVEFVPRDQIDPIRFERSYYLEPLASPKAYVLLSRVLESTERTAVVHLTLRTRTQLAAMRSREGVLMLHTLRWDDEVREPSFSALADDITITKQELAMSATLVDSLSEDFSPSKFTDDYQVQLQELIDQRVRSGGSRPVEEPADVQTTGGEVLDLMEALKRSVEQAKEKSDGSSRSGRKAPARRSRKAG